MDNGGSGDGAPLSICCASLLTQMPQPQPSCLSAPSTAVPCPCSAEGLQRVLLGPVCTRTTRTAQGVLLQLSGPMASAVVGIQRSVHVKAGVQKASLSIALGQKSCALWWHMQAMLHVGRGKQSRTIYLHSEPHILFCSSPGREMPADSCLGMRRSKHRAPMFSLCLP